MKSPQRLLAIASLKLLPVGLLFISSCHQEPLPPPASPPPTTSSAYYMRFKIDGVPYQYSSFGDCAMVNITNPNDSSYYGQFIACGSAQDYTRNYMAMNFRDFSQLVPNVGYTNYTPFSSTDQKLQLLAFNFTDANGVSFFSLDESLFAPLGLTSDGKFTITALTATYAKANFSATLYDNSYTILHHLTDGELYLERIQ